MKIVGLEGVSPGELDMEIQRGAKFVTFYYCISLLVVTFRRGTDIYFIRPGESAFAKALPWTLLSVLLGWWGIPWGPIYTIQSLGVNIRGGKDVTASVLPALSRTGSGAGAGSGSIR